MPRNRTESEKQRDWELGQEGERWIAKLFLLSGYKVVLLNPAQYFEGELMNILNLSEREKRSPDFRVISPSGMEDLVDAKYSTGGKIYYRNLEAQLRIYPDTHYIVICDARKNMIKALTRPSIRHKKPVMTGFPVEQSWEQIQQKTRLQLEEEIRDTQPFKRIKEKYGQTESRE